eukprot:g6078.t1
MSRANPLAAVGSGLSGAAEVAEYASSGTPLRVFIDVDIDGWRAAYARAAEFVAATNLRYKLSSDRLELLGGSEKKRIRSELYPNDYEWSSGGKIVTRRRVERIVFELWPKVAPLAVENFLGLVRGDKGKGECGKLLHYVGIPFHRVVPGFVVQGGDIAFGNGTGGESVWGKKFKDDREGLKCKFNKRGLLGMGNQGKNSNSSQFFVTFAAQPKLNGKHVGFGEMLSGEEVLAMIEAVGGDDKEVPLQPIVIADCGVLPPDSGDGGGGGGGGDGAAAGGVLDAAAAAAAAAAGAAASPAGDASCAAKGAGGSSA